MPGDGTPGGNTAGSSNKLNLPGTVKTESEMLALRSTIIAQLPEFFGENVEDYFRKVLVATSVRKFSDRDIVDLIRTKLNGDALKFYCANIELHLSTITFKEFREKFIKRFAKRRNADQINREFRKCTQNVGESVQKFAERLRNLKLELIKSQDGNEEYVDKQMLSCFKDELRPDIKKVLMPFMKFKTDLTFEEAVELAEQEELELASNKKGCLEVGAVNKVSHTPQQGIKCYNCGKIGHMRRDCRRGHSCARCGKLGHYAKDCRANFNQNRSYNSSRYKGPSRGSQGNNRGTYKPQGERRTQNLNGNHLSFVARHGRSQ